MSEPVELSVQSDLKKVIADLEALQKKAAGVTQQVARVGTELEKNLNNSTKATEKHFGRLQDLGRRLADQLRGYFQTIVSQTSQSLERIKKDVGLTKMLLNSKDAAIKLDDVLKKVGQTLGINADRMADFAKAATEAFRTKGYDSAMTARAIQGVARTQVRGESNILQVATMAADLSDAGGQRDQVGQIAQQIGEVRRSQGGDQNNMGAMRQIAEDVRKASQATGKAPTEVLESFKNALEPMAPESRAKMDTGTLRNVAAVEAVVGPSISTLFGELTSKPLSKLPLEMQGIGKLVGPKGFDMDKLDKIAGIGKRIGFDKTSSWQTSGLSEGSANAMVRMLELRAEARAAQNKASGMGGSLEQSALDSRGISENWKGNTNRVEGLLTKEMAGPIDKASGLLKKTSQSDAGSVAVVAGVATAATLAAAATSKIAGLLGGVAGGATSKAGSMAGLVATQQVVKDTIPVWVMNFSEVSNGLGGVANGLGGAAAGAAGAGTAAVAGMAGAAAGVVVGGTALAYQDEIETATSGKTLSRTDKAGGAKGGEFALLLDLGRQLLAQMTKNHNENREAAKRNAQTTPPQPGGGPAAAQPFEGGKY